MAKRNTPLILLLILVILLILAIVTLFSLYYFQAKTKGTVKSSVLVMENTGNIPISPSSSLVSDSSYELYKISNSNQVVDNYTDCLINPTLEYCTLLGGRESSHECEKDCDCDSDYSSNKYCKNNSVYRDDFKFSCQDNMCLKDKTSEKIQDCLNGCLNGKCNTTCSNSNCNITCSSDSNCDDKLNFTEDKCLNPGTENSSCTHTLITCFNDSQCGGDGLIDDPFCQDGNVFQNFLKYTCNNPGTINSSCSSTTTPELNQTCTESQTCQSGACVNKNITCYNDSQCGINGFTGSPYCNNSFVFKYFTSYACKNPGTVSSYCFNSTMENPFADCGSDYCENYGANYCKNSSVYKSRTCHNLGCENGGCFNRYSVDETLVETCGNNGCSNGLCN